MGGGKGDPGRGPDGAKDRMGVWRELAPRGLHWGRGGGWSEDRGPGVYPEVNGELPGMEGGYRAECATGCYKGPSVPA